MIAPNIDIPSGLEDAYNNVVSRLGGNNSDTIIVRRSSPARAYFSTYGHRSLFYKWQGLYNGLSLGRHEAWTAYWVTLPFGDHGGANGWPGSGFSGFVYLNAPRYRAGLSVLLDPPALLELLTNGSFTGNATGWTLTFGVSYSSNNLNYPSSPPGPSAPNASTTFNGSQAFSASSLIFSCDLVGNGKIGVAFGSGSTFHTIDVVTSAHFSVQLSADSFRGGGVLNIRSIGLFSEWFRGTLDNSSLRASS